MSFKRPSTEERNALANKRRVTGTTNPSAVPVSNSGNEAKHDFLDDGGGFPDGLCLRAFINTQAAQLFNVVAVCASLLFSLLQ